MDVLEKMNKKILAIFVILSGIIATTSGIGWYLQTPQPQYVKPEQVFIVIQNGTWKAIIPEVIMANSNGWWVEGRNYTGTFEEVTQWAMNQTKP